VGRKTRYAVARGEGATYPAQQATAATRALGVAWAGMRGKFRHSETTPRGFSRRVVESADDPALPFPFRFQFPALAQCPFAPQ